MTHTSDSASLKKGNLTQRHTPSCPENPDENDVRRRTISRIQQDVERELENADRVLSQVDGFTGSRSQSRAGNIRTRNDSGRKDGEFGAMDGYRVSEQGRSGSGSSETRAKPEECTRSAAHSVVEMPGRGSRGANIYDTQGGGYEGGGSPHNQYSMREGGGSPHNQYSMHEGGGSPHNQYSMREGGGSPHNQYSVHEGGGSPHNQYSVHEGGGSPHNQYSMHEGGGSPHKQYSVHEGGGSPHNQYSMHEGGGSPHNQYSVHEGGGAPHNQYSAHEGGGSPRNQYSMHEGGGSPRNQYSMHEGGGSPHDQYSMHERTRSPGGGYGSGHPYAGSGVVGSGYGVPDDPYNGTGAAGMGHDSYGAYPQDEDLYGVPKSPGTPGTGARTRDPSKLGYDQGKTPSGMPFDATSPGAYDSRGKSPPSVHYSPSTALSPRAGNSPRMQSSGYGSEARSGLTGDRSQVGTQFSASRAPSRAALESSDYERGVSPTGTHYSGSKAVSDIMGAGLDVMGFEGPGSHISPVGGSRGSPGRSTRGGSPTDGSKGTFGTKDQSVTNNKICPAALQGKCPAFARDSSPMEPSRPNSVATSGSKRPLSRIEEGPSSEDVPGQEPYGQASCFQEEDFRPTSGGIRCRTQQAREGLSTCPSQVPQRSRCEGSGPLMFDSVGSDRFQSMAPRPQPIGFAQPTMPSSMGLEHHHDHHDHDGDGLHGMPIHMRDEKATSALNHLSQIQKTPSYIRCRPDRKLDLSSCDKSCKDAPKMVKFPEKPCKGMEELQEMINCESEDVDSVWYLTSDEKKTYKKPCPKQQKAQENVKSIVKPQTPQTCPKEYTPLEHPDPDDITPELAASMMFSQEQGIKLNECPDETIKRFFPDMPRPPFPVKLSAVHIVDSNQEDQEEMIEKSASVPSEGVSDSAYTRTMQNKGEIGAQKSYDIDFAIGAEKREYVLVAEKPIRYNKVQFRGNLPSWFPGYMQAFPDDSNGMTLVTSPSGLFQKAWTNTNPENIPSNDVIVLE